MKRPRTTIRNIRLYGTDPLPHPCKTVWQMVGDYLAKYLSKEVRVSCLEGERLWAGFGNATWCRVEEITVRSWLGDEYRRLREGAGTITRKQSYSIKRFSGIINGGWREPTGSRSGYRKIR